MEVRGYAPIYESLSLGGAGGVSFQSSEPSGQPSGQPFWPIVTNKRTTCAGCHHGFISILLACFCLQTLPRLTFPEVLDHFYLL